ncbi:Cyanohydrin beta-glucosyltransferase [Hordeum vulgare]|nr:Cyanohydrin beta-glucosyltransferase [Hordeum vulgare]
MNLNDVFTYQQMQDGTPPPRHVTEEDRRIQRNTERRLLIAERDETGMAEWRKCFLEDFLAEDKFYA